MEHEPRGIRARDRLGWLSILLLGSIPFLLAFLSQGFASDEEVGRLQIARFAPETPDLFLSLRGRPLVTLLFAGPAQLGLLPVRLLSALASLLCGLVVFEALRRGGLSRWAALGPVFLFAQPLFLGYSYTAMTEPWGALLLALFLWTSVPSPNARLALVATLLPLVRLEFVVLWPIVLWALFPNHRRSLLLVPLGLVVWMLLGVLATGDWGWFAAQAQWSEYKAPHTFHYFQGWSWGSGPLVVLLASLGLLFRPQAATLRERSQRLWLNAAFMLLGLFLAYTAFATWRPTSGGNLRYLAFAAPALAVLSVFGARALWTHANRRGLLLGLLALFTLCLLVWSGVYRDDFRPSGKQTWLPALVAFGLVLVWFFRSRLVFAAVILAAAVAHQAAYHPNKLPWKASAEHLAIRDLAKQAPQEFIANAHPYFAYETGTNPFRHQTSLVQHPQIKVGDYMLWETHYSARQVHNLSPKDLVEDPAWSFSQGKVAHDGSWAGAIFKRVVNNENAGGSDNDDQIAWAREATMIWTGVNTAKRQVELNSEDVDALETLALGLLRANEVEEAGRVVLRMENLEGSAGRVSHLKGTMALQAGNMDAAHKHMEEAFALEPENGDIALSYARVLLQQRDPKAKQVVAVAAERLPRRWDAQYMAGRLALSDGEVETAVKHLRRARVDNPDFVDTYLQLARAYELNSEPAQSERCLRDLIDRFPSLPEGYLALAELFRSRGDTESAVAIQNQMPN